MKLSRFRELTRHLPIDTLLTAYEFHNDQIVPLLFVTDETNEFTAEEEARDAFFHVEIKEGEGTVEFACSTTN